MRRSKPARLSAQQRMTVRQIAAECYQSYPDDPERAKDAARAEIRDCGFFDGITLIILAIRLAILLIEWWRSRNITNPGSSPLVGEPGDASTAAQDAPQRAEALSQFPSKRRSQIAGTYDRLPRSERYRFNARDAGSVLAFVAVSQPVVAFTSYQIEEAASAWTPDVPAVLNPVLWIAWLGQTVLLAVIKGICNWVRSPSGISLFKDFFSWLSLLSANWVRRWILDFFFGWLPWRKRRRLPQPVPRPRRRIIERWRNRRRRRR